MNENAYNTLLERLGVEDVDGEFVMADGTAVSATLMGEMLRRELSENAKDTIELEKEKLRQENLLLAARTEALNSAKRIEELYAEALKALGSYKGNTVEEDDEIT